jgi:hypothetical protein
MTTGRGKPRVMYSMRIACPKCSMQQTFRGTPPEIGDAVEMWNSRHQLTAHPQSTGAYVKTDLTVTGRSSRCRRPATFALLWPYNDAQRRHLLRLVDGYFSRSALN